MSAISMQSIKRRNSNSIKCYICGGDFDLSDNKLIPTRDHLIPQSIKKWLPGFTDEIDINIINNTIGNINNIMFAHKECNIEKGCKVKSPNEFRKMKYVSKNNKRRYTSNYNKLHKYIEAYNSCVDSIIKIQNNTCLVCRCQLTDTGYVLRRLYGNLERSKVNACVVCSDCNMMYSSYTYHKGHKDLIDFAYGYKDLDLLLNNE